MGHIQTSHKQKLISLLHNTEAGNCVGQVGFIFTTHGLSADKICEYIIYGMSADKICDYILFGIWYLMDYIWQCFKNRVCFLQLSRAVLS